MGALGWQSLKAGMAKRKKRRHLWYRCSKGFAPGAGGESLNGLLSPPVEMLDVSAHGLPLGQRIVGVRFRKCGMAPTHPVFVLCPHPPFEVHTLGLLTRGRRKV